MPIITRLSATRQLAPAFLGPWKEASASVTTQSGDREYSAPATRLPHGMILPDRRSCNDRPFVRDLAHCRQRRSAAAGASVRSRRCRDRLFHDQIPRRARELRRRTDRRWRQFRLGRLPWASTGPQMAPEVADGRIHQAIAFGCQRMAFGKCELSRLVARSVNASTVLARLCVAQEVPQNSSFERDHFGGATIARPRQIDPQIKRDLAVLDHEHAIGVTASETSWVTMIAVNP
jgi:hypothetical protein